MGKRKRERDHMEPAVETARAWRQTGRGRAPPVAGERTPVARRGWKSARGWTPRAPAGADKPNVTKRESSWEAQRARLKAHKHKHGDCNEPQGWAKDLPFGRWVADQRQCKKMLDRGDRRQKITAERVAKLEALGFAWEQSAAMISSKHRSEGHRDNAGWDRRRSWSSSRRTCAGTATATCRRR